MADHMNRFGIGNPAAPTEVDDWMARYRTVDADERPVGSTSHLLTRDQFNSSIDLVVVDHRSSRCRTKHTESEYEPDAVHVIGIDDTMSGRRKHIWAYKEPRAESTHWLVTESLARAQVMARTEAPRDEGGRTVPIINYGTRGK
jgi:hypothetical protein